MLICIIIISMFVLMLWCFAIAPSRKDTQDYCDSIYAETMHELQDYDNH